jgi:peptidoglycan/xylan/chitin deacetylase (PgdA/CDA1 family)
MRNLEGLEPWNKGHSFRLKGRKLKTLNSNTWMHDYGWVNLNRYSSEEIKKHLQESQCHIAHLGHDELDAVIKFAGRHPQVMQNRIRAVNWNYSPPTELKSDWKDRLRMSLELLLGRRIGQNRNYIKL